MTKLTDVRSGDVLITAVGFTCIKPGPVTVYEDERGLYFCCQEGRHYLDGQCDEADNLIGLRVP